LEDLTAACVEAAEGDCKVEEFEVGVFCGKYMTGMPDDYFEHLSQMRQGKTVKTTTAGLTTVAPGGVAGNAVVVANSGPVNVVPASTDDDTTTNRNGIVTPDLREDIRFAITHELPGFFFLTD
jgi:amidophosphoribosyltransferase